MAPRVEKFGPYEIHGKLGSGGMGFVLLAKTEDSSGERWVALKRLHATFLDTHLVLKMFAHEAELLEKLDHPNLDKLYDQGSVEGEPYIALELFRGATLADLLVRLKAFGSSLSPEMSAEIVIQTLEALHYAHELRDLEGNPLNLIHRDVSPQNVIVTISGSVKLIDFGVARADVLTSLTKDGVLKGKYAYMSPEQILGAPVDRRSDIFAAGTLSWESFCASRLFYRESVAEIMAGIVSQAAPRLEENNPAVEKAVADVVHRALEKNPDLRFSTAAEMQGALRACFDATRLDAARHHLAKLVRQLFPERATLPGEEPDTQKQLQAVEDTSPDTTTPVHDDADPTETDTLASEGQSDTLIRPQIQAREPPTASAPRVRRDASAESASPKLAIGLAAVAALLALLAAVAMYLK